MSHIDQYLEQVQKIVDLEIISGNIVFNYDDAKFSDEYDNNYFFYQTNLNKAKERYSIDPSTLFYKSDYSSNAFAGKNKGHFVLCFHMGLMNFLFVTFLEKLNCDGAIATLGHESKAKLLDNPLELIMYQISMHFTFYHEMGHLVQKSDSLINNLNEVITNQGKFNIERHILELDADEFSTMYICNHLFMYGDRVFNGEYDKKAIEFMMVYVCYSILIYMLSFNGRGMPIYFEEHTHPHPVIRIMSTVMMLVVYTKDVLAQRGIELGSTPREIVDKSLEFSQIISKGIFDEDPIRPLLKDIEDNQKEIIAYVLKLKSLRDNRKDLAVEKYRNY